VLDDCISRLEWKERVAGDVRLVVQDIIRRVCITIVMRLCRLPALLTGHGASAHGTQHPEPKSFRSASARPAVHSQVQGESCRIP